jgi:hypothetical protein
MSTDLLYNSVGWQKAIQDAEEQLRETTGARASVLLGVIATFKAKIKRGEPWPGDENAGTADAIPA